MKLAADTNSAQRMNPTDPGDSLSFHLAPSSGQNFTTYNTCYDKIPAKLTQLDIIFSNLQMLAC